MRKDHRQLDARHAAILQLIAEELRATMAREGTGGGELAQCVQRIEGLAAEILVGGHPWTLTPPFTPHDRGTAARH
jgi:hypothetical protein